MRDLINILNESGQAVKIHDIGIDDSRGGEMFGYKEITVGKTVVCRINLSIYQRGVYIKYIETLHGYEGQGYAKQLVDDLFRECPADKGYAIYVTNMTDDGSAFFRKNYQIDKDGKIVPKIRVKSAVKETLILQGEGLGEILTLEEGRRRLDAYAIECQIKLAGQVGFRGFGGLCGEAAVAINEVIFDGKGKLVGAFNAAFLNHHRFLGHVAVLVDGAYWDADGRPKSLDEIESWGMLDEHDPDYAEEAEKLGIVWNDMSANEYEVVEFDNATEVLEIFGREHLASMIEKLKMSLTEEEAQPVDDHEFLVRAYEALKDIPDDVVVDLSGYQGYGFYSEHPIVMLDYIEVPEELRGEGIGSKVMTILTNLADQMGVAIALSASDEDNEDFYFKFGFSGNGKMIREPKTEG